MVYDPRSHGARCDECPLAHLLGRRVVPPRPPRSPSAETIAVVGEAPGADEEKEGEPFVGDSGMELKAGTDAVGLRWGSLHLTNAVLCRPPNNKLDVYMRGLEGPSPVECCRPRLLRELAPYRKIITVGAIPLQALTDTRSTITAIRGSALTTPKGRKLLPTVHPAFVLRQPRWRRWFRFDLARALRWFAGELRWEPPTIHYQPSPEQLRRFLELPSKWWAWDLETEWKGALDARIYCAGIGTDDGSKVVVVPLLSIDGQTLFYRRVDLQEIHRILVDFWTSPRWVKLGQNSIAFDAACVRARYGGAARVGARTVQPGVLPDMIVEEVEPHRDLISLHRSAEPYSPHSLAFMGSTRTDVHAWKEDAAGRKFAKHPRSDKELGGYNGTDVSVTARVVPSLLEDLAKVEQVHIAKLDMQLQHIGRGMYETGMPIHQPTRVRWEEQLGAEALRWLERARAILDADHDAVRAAVKAAKAEEDEYGVCEEDEGETDDEPVAFEPAAGGFNPGSPLQVRAVLFGVWGLVPPSTLDKKVAYTSSGDPSTGEPTLIAFELDRGLPKQVRQLAHAIRFYRGAVKGRGYTRAVRPPVGNEKLDKGCILRVNGRVHATWHSHGPATGRYSSSPNMQNWPFLMRDIVACEGEDEWFAGVDGDAIELKYASAEAQDPKFLELFAKGGDPHAATALDVFGAAFKTCEGQPNRENPKGSGTYKDYRDISKILNYLLLYGGSARTAWLQLRSTKDRVTGELLYKHITLAQVRAFRRKWLRAHPAFEAWWDTCIAFYREHGYIEEKATGRRSYFPDGEDFNQIPNFSVQAGCAGVIHLATLELVRAFPHGHAGLYTGLMAQGHDALDFATRGRKQAETIASAMTEAMRRRVKGLDVQFSGKGKIGKTWKEV